MKEGVDLFSDGPQYVSILDYEKYSHCAICLSYPSGAMVKFKVT